LSSDYAPHPVNENPPFFGALIGPEQRQFARDFIDKRFLTLKVIKHFLNR